jgi:hypothetical protein
MINQPEMLRRVQAAQATLDEFKGKPFKFGERDCVRLVAAHLRRLGYAVLLPSKGSYATARSALKALKARGFETVAQGMDGMGFQRIPVASALVGDIVSGAADDPLGALGILLGNGRLVGYHEQMPGAAVLQVRNMDVAWRAAPRPIAQRKAG